MVLDYAVIDKEIHGENYAKITNPAVLYNTEFKSVYACGELSKVEQAREKFLKEGMYAPFGIIKLNELHLTTAQQCCFLNIATHADEKERHRLIIHAEKAKRFAEQAKSRHSTQFVPTTLIEYLNENDAQYGLELPF